MVLRHGRWGSAGTGCSLARSALRFAVLQGPAELIDDRSDAARADLAASAGARRSDRWDPHRVTLDQLERVLGGEQPRGARETLQSASDGCATSRSHGFAH